MSASRRAYSAMLTASAFPAISKVSAKTQIPAINRGLRIVHRARRDRNVGKRCMRVSVGRTRLSEGPGGDGMWQHDKLRYRYEVVRVAQSTLCRKKIRPTAG